MRRINLYEIFRFGAAIEILGDLKSGTVVQDVVVKLRLAHVWLAHALKSDHIPIKENKKAVLKLIELVDSILKQEVLTPEQAIILDVNFTAFRNTLASELSRLHIYFVPQLLGYDSDTLLTNGIANLSPSFHGFLSDLTKSNFNEGCRCLALNQPTAAGFMLLRATEDVMHSYYDVISGGASRLPRRNMGDYIAALEKIPAVKPEMLAVIRDIKNLRRNPLMHPEHILDISDAVAVFDVSKSAISAMVRQAMEHQAALKKP
jgi:hypothetical protein